LTIAVLMRSDALVQTPAAERWTVARETRLIAAGTTFVMLVWVKLRATVDEIASRYQCAAMDIATTS
jgi:hypothetical protein